ncbi:MAG: hypothetical protein M3238_02255 [Actinomycetota bacterium]|nr:hypothetical protein [Actinomycetota bacterium]
MRRVPALVGAVAFVAIAGCYFGYVRSIVALAMAAAILYLGFSYFRSAGSVPPDAEAEDVTKADVRYICNVCGLELKVEVATTNRAPTHCREPMKKIERNPPLRTI